MSAVLQAGELLRGAVFAVLGVGFWAAGVVVAAYLYKRIRGEDLF